MKKIRSSKKGFTLAELLIVVAIIGVLVGISIPIFTAQLEKSREATDIANLRAAKAAAVSLYLAGDGSEDYVTWTTTKTVNSKEVGVPSDGFTAYYDAANGKLVKAKPTTGYGEGTDLTGNASNTQFGYAPATSVKDQAIKVVVNNEGNCTFTWE